MLEATGQSRFYLILLGAFAIVALVLAGVGIYGVQVIPSRGEHRRSVFEWRWGRRDETCLSSVVFQGIIHALAGVAAGMAGALALSRLMTGLLYGTPPQRSGDVRGGGAGAERRGGRSQLHSGATRYQSGSYCGAAVRVRKTMRTLLQDLSYGLRMLRKSPGLTGIILISATLGIGATTAVFTVFDAILLRPLAYERSPNNWCSCGARAPKGPFQQFEFSYPDYLDVKKENNVFSQIGGYSGSSVTLSGKDGAEQLPVAVATTGFFETLGVRPILGGR